MRFHRPSRVRPNGPAEQSDLLEPGGQVSGIDGRGWDRKTLQLCSQVADTLNYVLSGECDDELLQNLQVFNVVPAPNASQLLVTVYPFVATDTHFDAAEVHRRLSQAAGRLRWEVASSITRKKAPKLLFRLVEFAT